MRPGQAHTSPFSYQQHNVHDDVMRCVGHWIFGPGTNAA